MDNTEKTIAKTAVAALVRTAGIKGRYAKGYLVIDQGNNELKFKLKAVAQIMDQAAVGILSQDKDIDHCIIVTRHVYPKQAQLFKQLNIPFIDTAGNAFINKPPLFIFIHGEQTINQEAPKLLRAFKKTGLKLIFAFLCVPGLENKPYRAIAQNADIALGAVGRLMQELTEKGFLRKRGKKGFKLVNKEELLKRWATAYPEQLKPGLIVEKFFLPNLRDYLNRQNNEAPDVLWGGELAAERWTNHLVAKNAIIYTNQNLNQLAFQLRLQKKTDGNLEIIKRFWNFEYRHQCHTVPPILIYADLLATGMERNIETAGEIYDQEIQEFLI